jgi:uncharacterized protein YxjI
MADGKVYVLNQKMLSLSGDLWIEDTDGNHAYEVAGRVLSMHDTHFLQDLEGRPLYEISQSLAHLHRTFEIKKDGAVVATIQQAMLTFLGDRFKIVMADRGELAVTGDWIDREFHVTQAGADVIYASRRLLSLRDSYGIQIAPTFDTPLALAIVIGLEQMEREERAR